MSMFCLKKAKMADRNYFSRKDLFNLDEVLKMSEELVNNYFKMSSGQWLKNRYDVKTQAELETHEIVDGPFAQVIKYEGRKKDVPLGSSSFSLYKICLQDPAIISTVKKNEHLYLEPFLLYILTHELIHIIRFSRFQKRYENKNEADVTHDEEKKVHQLTHEILKDLTYPGLSQVFEFYKDWLDQT